MLGCINLANVKAVIECEECLLCPLNIDEALLCAVEKVDTLLASSLAVLLSGKLLITALFCTWGAKAFHLLNVKDVLSAPECWWGPVLCCRMGWCSVCQVPKCAFTGQVSYNSLVFLPAGKGISSGYCLVRNCLLSDSLLADGLLGKCYISYSIVNCLDSLP